MNFTTEEEEGVENMRRRSTLYPTSSEGESSTRNQNPNEAGGTFDRRAGDGMGEGNQIHEINLIGASLQHHNTQGKFDCNSGSYNNYGDKSRGFINKGTLINEGEIVMNFRRTGRREGLKNIGRGDEGGRSVDDGMPGGVRRHPSGRAQPGVRAPTEAERDNLFNTSDPQTFPTKYHQSFILYLSSQCSNK